MKLRKAGGVLLIVFAAWCILTLLPSNAHAADYTVKQWQTVEITLESSKTYADPFNNVDVTATFTGPGGLTITRPAFWNGGAVWKIRFAPTAMGAWTMTTNASDTTDTGLHNISKTVEAGEYTGTLAIYKHGFLKVGNTGRYLTYADGTPFFYLGDTHWIMPHERFSTSNVPGIASQFKYTVDKRVTQGFTVYQSEPIWAPHGGGTHTGLDEEAIAVLNDGFTSADLAGFENLDRKFKYIADQGLVHANAQVAWALDPKYFPDVYTDAYMARIAKYWVARYGSYPAIWTIAQEIDANMYGNYTSATMSKWYAVGQSLSDNDAYHHPIMPHMENVIYTTAANSSWASKSYHDGWAVQAGDLTDMNIGKGFWNHSSAKPSVLYESMYDQFWTDSRGALGAAYQAFQSGMYGYGYGVAGVWNDAYSKPGAAYDFGTGYELPARYLWWYDGANAVTGDQLLYFNTFYTSLEWWKLIPRFDSSSWSSFNSTSKSLLSSDGSNTYVVFSFNNSTATGSLKQMDNSWRYKARWFNPRSGEYTTISNTIQPSSGQWVIPNKPDTSDWVLLVEKSAESVSTTAMPNANSVGGLYNDSVSVTLSTPTSGATIRYTTDGSTPTESSPLYSGPVTISGGTKTLKAVAFKSGLANSPIMSEIYKASSNLALSKTYASSSSWDVNQTAEKAFDSNLFTNWQACYSCWSGQWLEVNLGSNKTFNKVVLSEYGNRTQGYTIEYWNGTSWLTAYTGTVLGSSKTLTFNAVTGSKVRINFTSGNGDAPIIYEFEIYYDSKVMNNLAIGKAFSSSSSLDANQTAAKAFDQSLATNWQACYNCWNGQWLEVNFGTNTTFNKVELTEYGNRTQGYKVEYWNGTSWLTAYTGTTISSNWGSRVVTFNTVTGSKVRILFTSGNTANGPIIYEFGVYNDPAITTNLAIGKTYSSSSNLDANQTAAKAFDQSLASNWQACTNCWSGQWLEVNFGANTTFNTAVLSEFGGRTTGYQIEYWNGTVWDTAYVGSTIGTNWNSRTVTFNAVTGSKARIVFASGTGDAPIIYEFEIYNR
ncbi:apiosidase-like domain-containing protein [Cohnella abietis]|nr:discoidin domain-containing protein [Cohnella abietis]